MNDRDNLRSVRNCGETLSITALCLLTAAQVVAVVLICIDLLRKGFA